MKCCRIKTTGQGSSARWNNQVVCSCQTGNAVQKDHNVLFVLNQTFCTLDHHLWHTFMMLRKLIKGRINNFHIIPFNGFFDVGYFFRTFIDQKDQKMDLRIILPHRKRHLLQQGCLTCFRRWYDHASLSLTNWRDQIHNTHCSAALSRFQSETFIWENRCHIFKVHSASCFCRRHSIDLGQIQKRTEFFRLCLYSCISCQDIPCLQAESADLRWWYIYIFLARQIVLGTDKSVSIHDFQNSIHRTSTVELFNICGSGFFGFYFLLRLFYWNFVIFFQHKIDQICFFHRWNSAKSARFCHLF